MKSKYIYITLLLLLIYSTTHAQIFKPGIVIGLCATDLDGADLRDGDNDFSKAGFTAGGSLNVKLSQKNSLQFEINYIQKGTLQKAYDSLGNGYYKLNLNYVEVPLMFRHNIIFTMRKRKVDNFYLEFGPSYGRLVQVKQEGTYDYGGGFQNNFYYNDFSINIGAGLRIYNHLYGNIRYSNSFISVVEQSTLPAANGFLASTINKGHNMVWAFTLRYVFGKNIEKEKEKETEEEQQNN